MPTQRVEIVVCVHDGGEQMLTSVLLHVVSTAGVVDFLADSRPWRQRLR